MGDGAWVIRTAEGEHLGFLLMRGGPASGHCVIRSLPFDAGNFDIPESEHLFALQQQGEFPWSKTDAGLRIYDGYGSTVATVDAGRMTSADFRYEITRAGERD